MNYDEFVSKAQGSAVYAGESNGEFLAYAVVNGVEVSYQAVEEPAAFASDFPGATAVSIFHG